MITIATRKSPLALWQARYVAKKLQYAAGVTTRLVEMSTQGDKITDVPLAKIGGKGLFVKALEEGILAGNADIAVHSLKDVPVVLPAGLHLAAVMLRDDPSDALVSNRYMRLEDLPPLPRIGTSSLRRCCQLKQKLPNAQILPLRGNVNTRLAKLDNGDFDAIILATAGLKRLGLEQRISQRLAPAVCLPAIGQGAIAIESRCDDATTNAALKHLLDPTTLIATTAERALNARLDGGCQVPIAGFAEISGNTLLLRGLVGAPDGSAVYRSTRQTTLAQTTPNHTTLATATQLGTKVAEDLLNQGAGKILQSLPPYSHS